MDQKIYFKVTDKESVDLDFKCLDGINVKTGKPGNELVLHNFSFTSHEHIHKFYHCGKYLRIINLPTTDKNFIMIYNSKLCMYYANNVQIGEKYSLADPDTYKKFNLRYPSGYALVLLEDLNFLKYLIKQKIISTQKECEELLILSAKYGKLELVQYLVEIGTNINTIYDNALSFASKAGYFDVVKYLVDNGANVRINNDNALRMSLRSNNYDIVKYLVDHGARLDSNIDILLNKSISKKIIKYLFKHAVDIHYNDNILLRTSARFGLYNIVKTLIEFGANINAKNGSALYLSQLNGHTKITNLLIANGAISRKNPSDQKLKRKKVDLKYDDFKDNIDFIAIKKYKKLK